MENDKLQSLVERITHKVLKEMMVKRKRVLFIFCDSSAHECYLDQLISLQQQNMDYDLLFLDGETSAWLGIQQIQSTGAGQIIAADEYAKAPLELPKDYDAVVIPEIDLDNAARVCSGLKGSVKAEIIFSALVLNKPVIIGEESTGLKRADRRTLHSIELPIPLRRRFEKYKQELVDLGIYFSKKEQLHQKISLLMNLNDGERPDSTNFNGKVLSTNWLTFHPSKTVVVKDEVIITPLARDFIKEKGIQLIKGADP